MNLIEFKQYLNKFTWGITDYEFDLWMPHIKRHNLIEFVKVKPLFQSSVDNQQQINKWEFWNIWATENIKGKCSLLYSDRGVMMEEIWGFADINDAIIFRLRFE